MREIRILGLVILEMATLTLALSVFSRPLLAEPPGPTAAEPTQQLVPPTPPPDPMTDLPASPASPVEGVTLFPGRDPMAPANLNDQRFGYVLHGEATSAYESNIFIQSHDPTADFIFTISPGLAVGWGEFKSELYGPDRFRYRFDRYQGKNYIYANYSPSYTWFANRSDQDKFDHNAKLDGEWTIDRLTLGVLASYVTKNAPEEDVGTRVETRRLSAALTSKYEYSGKTFFEVNGYYDSVDFADNQVDSREWRNADWMNYQISPKVLLGLGGEFAYVDRSEGPSETYQRALARVQYVVSDKLTVGVSGGAEFRQTSGEDSNTDGAFELNLVWTPFDGTYFYLEGFRRAVNSGTLANEYYVATGAQLQFRQRLFQRFYFNLSSGYQNADYQNPQGATDFGRKDNLFFVRPGVGVDFATWLNCEITGEYRKNDSNIDQHQFDSTTAAIKFNVLF